ncbi:DUF7455 domain-containing protein [Actinotignum urinale]|uniref:DUF7455 domain-containing protein n=2 Tax=Actinotignum urinale TaxID=190146 RepID=A0AAW9HNQ6_9ACTO|nr:hypothetical protein [Actinotignum urinale]MDY5129520.1 hypothetical protein [Actinotignum urinale]MDY5132181.1 hypothetical protein [Actinotignum urinale]MDY5155407.1 hypothetical protein [Actinotignum urinale]MDY5160891.1 hypothetical protein [Actinotignum urinale]
MTDERAQAQDVEALTAVDRCDACGAQAYVRVCMPYGELLFCGHHANKHLDVLKDGAMYIQDERASIK